MVLGDLGFTRRLSGNPSITNVSDADITTALDYGTSRVISFTGKTDWETDTANPAYDQVVVASEYFAASLIKDRFQDQLDTSSELYRRGENILRDLMNASFDPSGVVGTATAHYRSYPLNPSAPIFRSTISAGQQLYPGVANWYIYNF